MDDSTQSAVSGPEDVPAHHALHRVSGPDEALTAIVLGSRDVVVGRSPGPDGVAIEDARASRAHAQLSRAPRRDLFLVRDLDSKNGVFVNGLRVTSRVLEVGDVVRIGDTLLVYEPVPASLDGSDEGSDVFVGLSSGARAVRRELVDAARAGASVLVSGETGTGKELVATLVHRRSGRGGPFHAVNCGAIPAGLAEAVFFGHRRGAFTSAEADREGHLSAADGGTLFLDEVAELPASAQAALLRVLEDGVVVPVGATRGRSVDVRVIAATHADLAKEVAGGRFRADLHARLARWTLRIPALRERRRDVLEIARRRLRPGVSITADASEALLCAPWPGNARELISAVDRGQALLHDRLRIDLADLPAEIAAPIRHRASAPAASAAPFERPSAAELMEALRESGGSVTRVAQQLGRTRKQIYRWIEAHGLDLARLRE